MAKKTNFLTSKKPEFFTLIKPEFFKSSIAIVIYFCMTIIVIMIAGFYIIKYNQITL